MSFLNALSARAERYNVTDCGQGKSSVHLGGFGQSLGLAIEVLPD